MDKSGALEPQGVQEGGPEALQCHVCTHPPAPSCRQCYSLISSVPSSVTACVSILYTHPLHDLLLKNLLLKEELSI